MLLIGVCALDQEMLIVVGSRTAGIKANQLIEPSLFPTNILSVSLTYVSKPLGLVIGFVYSPHF
jgi:hypothetical protein